MNTKLKNISLKLWHCPDGNPIKMKIWQVLNKNLLVSVSEFRVVVSVSNTDTIPPGIARLIPIPRVSLNSNVVVAYKNDIRRAKIKVGWQITTVAWTF